MKKLLLLAATWITLSACTKEASVPARDNFATESNIQEGKNAENVKASVMWTADPAVDGYGWIIRLSKDHFEVPKNLPEAFKQDGLEVIVSYEKTRELFPCRCSEPEYYVRITSISYLNP